MLEDMLRMYVMDRPTKWEDYLHLVEFEYNNVQQASLEMSPYESLYGRRCRTPVTWDNLVKRVVLGQGNGERGCKDQEKSESIT